MNRGEETLKVGYAHDSDIRISVNLGSILLTGATEGGKKRYGGKKEP
jgi:hypothetical protein